MKNILLLLLTASFAWAGGGQESDAILNQTGTASWRRPGVRR
jgi:hypothetical protein